MSRPRLSRRRLSALAVAVLAVGLLGILAPGALADALTPESGGSGNADSIDSLYKYTLVLAAIVFFGVEGALVYCLIKYKARKGREAAQIHGNTNLEIGWTVGAALILVFLTVLTFIKLGDIRDPKRSDPAGLQLGSKGPGVLTASTDIPKPPDGKALRICVQGRQYIWRYTYAPCDQAYGKPYSYERMVVPEKTTVILDITANDVIHSWWIPKLGGKMDAVPGYHNYTWFQAPKAGVTYTGNCAELCGRNHANMSARVSVVTPTEYESFISNLGQQIQSANKAAAKDRGLQQAGL